MPSKRFDNFAGTAALAAGIGGILYSVAFVFLVVFALAPALGLTLASLLLLVGGILSACVMVSLFEHVREVDSSFATIAIVIALFGTIGGATHGAYDLANQFHPPSSDVLEAANYPSQIDPRGLATFGMTGIGLFLFGWLMGQSKTFPTRLGQLVSVAGVLYVIIYLARLIILDPKNPIVLLVAGVTGLIVSPALFIWLGLRLRALAK